jgi:hypothetical protein
MFLNEPEIFGPSSLSFAQARKVRYLGSRADSKRGLVLLIIFDYFELLKFQFAISGCMHLETDYFDGQLTKLVTLDSGVTF